MGGFYARTWKLRTGNAWLTVNTLHLYISKTFPVYLWSLVLGETTAWFDEETIAFLASAGRSVFAELTTSETAE
ncbi:hypothetical protein ACQR18_08585 [Bradyrhizobium oligotrophicum]|uniref:hypothetical protein n=1 Tax=Bradyrhizobium oligotrophicum TaxID=44255 RepID=UPI003EC098FA